MTKSALVLATVLAFVSVAAEARSNETAQAKPAGYRTATYTGGEGATWKTGRDSHGFSGTYGGCRYTGHAGPRGYAIDRVCR